MDFVAAKSAEASERAAATLKVALSTNPEKLRSMLRQWFVPEFQPEFVEVEEKSISNLDDVGLIGPPATPARLPDFMFDIDTGNLVGNLGGGITGQYCMLSHRWKGREVDFGFVARARSTQSKKEFDGLAEDSTPAEERERGSQLSDVDAIKLQCKDDLEEQEKKIADIARSVLGDKTPDDTYDLVADLLAKRIKASNAEWGYNAAKVGYSAAVARSRHSDLEDDAFKNLLGGFEKKGEEEAEIEAEMSKTQAEEGKVQAKEIDSALKRLSAAEQTRAEAAEEIAFFERHRVLREAVDEIIGRLQQWRSAVKIDLSIQQAKNVFGTKLFPKKGGRYVWLDTCCINKSSHAIYTESMSLMGDWYGNAEFCLVHLDSTLSADEQIADWKQFKKGIIPHPGIASYGEIQASKPEWSNRGWTLQELVMSKTTFYVNSQWAPLSRPIESIGPYYYLCPFIELYTELDRKNVYEDALGQLQNLETLAAILDEAHVENPYGKPEDSIGSASADEGEGAYQKQKEEVIAAQKLIVILETLGVEIPEDIELNTARSWTAQAVHFAAIALGSDQLPDERATKLLGALLSRLDQGNGGVNTAGLAVEEKAKHAINLLLKSFVKLTKDLIIKDREYIANFGKVRDLRSWELGKARSKFPTHRVMALAGERVTTVATDRAYSLMGLLGVRFPAFQAEGLTKALSRLLDEVIIASNDVSVFNWSGKHAGSPIRGRSMYPSTPDAFRLSNAAGEEHSDKNKQLAQLFQIKRYEVMGVFTSITGMLRETITFVKKQDQKHLPVNWLQELLKVVKFAEFSVLKPHLNNIGKIVLYIQTNFDFAEAETPSSGQPEGAKLEKTASNTSATSTSGSGGTGGGSSLPFGLKPSIPSASSLVGSVSMPRFPGRKSAEPEATPAPQAAKKGLGGLGGGLGKLKGFGTKKEPEPAPVQIPEAKSQPPAPSSPALSAASTLVAESQEQARANKRKQLDEAVIKYIQSISPPPPPPPAAAPAEDGKQTSTEKSAAQQASSSAELPPELKEVLADIPEPQFDKAPGDFRPEDIESMICPNPIIVNTWGIEGLLDIQRVVVTMLQPEAIRRQVDNAVSPDQKISGWCSISTGFALVVVGFSCEKHILQKELDVIKAVEHKVLKEKKEDGPTRNRLQRRATGNDNGSSGGGAEAASPPTPATPPPASASAYSSLRIPSLSSYVGGKAADSEQQPGKEAAADEGDTEESQKVKRMIDFVQEPRLEAIAGEWVLARFSGVPGAKWFLCHLELGSGRGDFYGRRIATDDIDFHGAAPELGLMHYWENYMMRKKRKMCNVLGALLNTKNVDGTVDELARELAELTARGGGVDDEEGGGEDADDSGGEDPSAAGGGGGLGAGLIDFGRRQVAARVRSLASTAVQTFFEMKADYLDKSLSASVLKRTPAHLQAALVNMDDNKDLLPAMFHSAKKIHLF